MLKQTAAAAAVIACSMLATASAAGDIEITKTGLSIEVKPMILQTLRSDRTVMYMFRLMRLCLPADIH